MIEISTKKTDGQGDKSKYYLVRRERHRWKLFLDFEQTYIDEKWHWSEVVYEGTTTTTKKKTTTNQSSFSLLVPGTREERSPSWQFVIFDMLITKFIFTQHKHVHAHTHTGIDTKKGEASERESAHEGKKIMAHEEKNMVEGQNKQLSAHTAYKCEKQKKSIQYSCLSH